jgi:hypothetical protein
MENIPDFDNIYKVQNEDEMFILMESKIKDINWLTSTIKYNLKHVRILLIVSILLVIFNQPGFIWGLSWGFFLLMFLRTSSYFSRRSDILTEVGLLLVYFKLKGFITEENEEKIKNYKVDLLWFEK